VLKTYFADINAFTYCGSAKNSGVSEAYLGVSLGHSY